MSERRVNQQSMVDSWYHRLVTNLKDQYHEELPWDLIMMGRAAAQISMDIDRAFVEKHKDTIIKSMLMVLANKTSDITYSDREHAEMIAGVRKIGMPWQELDIIEKSFAANRSINEGPVDPEEKARLRDEGRKLVIDMMRRKAEDSPRGIFYVMYHLDEWGFKLGDWPEIREMIDSHKHDIIVDILKGIKLHGADGTESARFTVNRMRKIGVDWPELDKIEKSINSDKVLKEGQFDAEERRTAMEYVEDLPEIAGSPGDCMYVFQFAHGHELLFGPSLKQFFDPHRDTWVRFLLENMKDGFHFNTDELLNAVKLLRRMGIRWPELDIIEKSLDADMELMETAEIPKDLDAQIELIKTHPWMIGNIWAPAAELQRMVLTLDGSYLGSIKGGLNARVLEDPVIKDNIIKHLLWLIKERHLDRLRDRLEDLNWVRVSWPEVKTIRKSLDSDRKRLREDFDAFGIDDVIHALTNGAGKALSTATDVVLGFDDASKAALKSAMVQYKSSIMANLLDTLFIPDKHNANAMIRLLKATGVDWPEFSNLPYSLEPMLQREIDDRIQGGAAAALDCFDALRTNGIDFSDMENKFREQDLPRMTMDYAKDPHTPSYVLANDIAALSYLGVDPSLMRSMLETRKDNLIRALLGAIKGRNYQDANVIISTMRDFGIQWKELDVFERSLSSGSLEESDEDASTLQGMVDALRLEIGKDTLNLALRGFLYKLQDRYDLSPEQIDELLAPIMGDLVNKFSKHLSGRGISIGLKDISHMATLGLYIAPLVKLVRDNKTAIMRFMLENIREKQSTAICIKYVEMLERMGIDWPEFTAIRRANSAEWQQIRLMRNDW